MELYIVFTPKKFVNGSTAWLFDEVLHNLHKKAMHCNREGKAYTISRSMFWGITLKFLDMG